MKIILHADDFGYNEDTVEATIELFEKGALTSASIMVNMPASDIAVSYAKAHPEKSWGVHLTYVDELRPVLDASLIPSLVDERGLFLDSNLVRKKAMLFKIAKTDIISESLAQIAKLQDAGIQVSHLDSHGHLHKFPSFLFSMREIAKRTGIKRIRRVQNVFINSPQRGLKSFLNTCFDVYIRHNFKSTDYFYMPANTLDTEWSGCMYKNLMNFPQNKVIEIGVHPGNAESWRVQEKADMEDFYRQIILHDHNVICWNNV